MDTVPLQPDMYSAVAVGIAAQGLTYSDLFRQRQLLRRDVHTPDIVIVSAAGYLKEAAHLADAVFLPVTVDPFVFDACFHPFPVSERKSRMSSFSIFSRCISYACSATISLGAASL